MVSEKIRKNKIRSEVLLNGRIVKNLSLRAFGSNCKNKVRQQSLMKSLKMETYIPTTLHTKYIKCEHRKCSVTSGCVP